jgi:membrane associated rhomboid family serine protease
MPTIVPPSWSMARARSYVLRLPLLTRCFAAAIVLFWIAGLQGLFDVRAWGDLDPKEVGFGTLYRLNTFPFVHLNLFHAFFNILALTPLLERFEMQNGTLTSLALFLGPFGTIPAVLYLFVEKYIFWGSTAIMGASIWVFLLLGVEAIQTFRANPKFNIGSYFIPTWTTPLMLLLVVEALMPSSSFLGHICGLVVGYAWGLGYIRFLAPPDKILRWIEGKLGLLERLPRYVSVDQKTYGRFGVLPSNGGGIPLRTVGGGQRLGA